MVLFLQSVIWKSENAKKADNNDKTLWPAEILREHRHFSSSEVSTNFLKLLQAYLHEKLLFSFSASLQKVFIFMRLSPESNSLFCVTTVFTSSIMISTESCKKCRGLFGRKTLVSPSNQNPVTPQRRKCAKKFVQISISDSCLVDHWLDFCHQLPNRPFFMHEILSN